MREVTVLRECSWCISVIGCILDDDSVNSCSECQANEDCEIKLLKVQRTSSICVSCLKIHFPKTYQKNPDKFR